MLRMDARGDSPRETATSSPDPRKDHKRRQATAVQSADRDDKKKARR
jgi:hypothetical protein